MSYTMLNNDAIRKYDYASDSLEGAALSFIRDWCEELRFDKKKATSMNTGEIDFEGTSLKKIKFHSIWKKILIGCVLKMP